MARKWRLLVILAAILSMMLVACGDSPSGDTKNRSTQLSNGLNAAKDDLQNKRAAFDTEISQKAYAFLQKYSDADKHVTNFTAAQAKLDEANKVYNEQVKAVLDDYENGKQDVLNKSMDQVQQLTQDAQNLAGEPINWIRSVAKTQKDPAGTVLTAENNQATLAKVRQELASLAADSKRDWPNQTANIDRKVTETSKELDAAAAKLDRLHKEAAKHPPNYAVMTQLTGDIAASQKAFADKNDTVRKQFADLPTTETRTLIDMRVDGEISVGRTSWDEDSDWDNDHDYDYQPFVTSDAEPLVYFGQFAPGTMIASDGAWSDFKTENSVDRAMWDKLGIDSRKDWVSGDDAAEYYLDEVEMTVCNKLRVLRNGNPDSSGRPAPQDNECDKYNTPQELKDGIYWVEAEEPQPEDIGMDIYSKGAGDFNEQATEAASPPGIVYVGDPHYGEWRHGDNGQDFWAFYGQYMFIQSLIGGPSPYYYRNEYDTWGRDYRYQKKDYYAGTSTTPRFGAASPQTSSRFPNSNFNKSNLSKPSVRSAGPMTRGGGPGGGGK